MPSVPGLLSSPGWGLFLSSSSGSGVGSSSVAVRSHLQFHRSPGDTLEIRGGFYKIRGCNEQVGNYQAQQYIANLQHPKQHGIVFGTFPYNKQLKWNIREFGPLPVPQKGHVVEMDRTTYHLYKQLIGWEQKKKLRLKDGQVLLGDSLISRYRFEKNYYFVSGEIGRASCRERV